ncbi:GGDEF domain-containing protein [Telmatospirillum sp. J64-1]|uniref:GGDEF domain-containing protein n=1 Tax=Telmatospirillum sp. J64-1 TaxID=2502183 RepID=UPI00115DF9CC|nr:GGDEF domain-containing protein [Telmatospirillum sp. J64-1]
MSEATLSIAVDSFTLFAANAIILVVMAGAFFSAWRKQRDSTYWISWVAANLALSAALVIFMVVPAERAGLLITLANCLLVVGFGLRWRAARQFTGRPAPWFLVWGATIPTAIFFAFPSIFGYGTAYFAVNIILAVQSMFIAWEFQGEKQRDLPSSYGLICSYLLMGLSFAFRAAQGLFLNDEMGSYLPQDILLEIHLLIAVVHTVSAGAFALSISYERAAISLRRIALQDPLTGLYNRRAFEGRLREVLEGQRGQGLAIVLFDIDHFKAINDRYGHAAGDAALQRCAGVFLETLRQSDFVARIGGEEFAAILPDISAHDAYEVAERVRQSIEGCQISTKGTSFALTLSAGICHSVTDEHDVDELLRQADKNLYRAKETGRNRVECGNHISSTKIPVLPVGAD